MLVWTIVVNDAEVGLSEVVDPGCDVVVEGVLEVDEGVLDVEEGGFDEVVEEGGFEVLVCCCELVEDTETGVEVDAMEEVAESVGVVVELEDIVNCLNLRSLGRLKPRTNLCDQHFCVDREGVDVSTLARASDVLLAALIN